MLGASALGAAQPVVDKILSEIVAPLIWLLFAVALIYFLYGAVKYLWNAASSEERDKGRKHMIWAVIGMAIMLSAFGITQFIFSTVTDGGTAEDLNGDTILTPSTIDKGSF
ncbi:MAG: pilin [Patescibacteria group bacterium]